MNKRRTYRDGLLRAKEIAELYADENMRMADDTIRADPILSRRARSEIESPRQLARAEQISQELAIDGCVYSSRSYAADDIAEAIQMEIDRQ